MRFEIEQEIAGAPDDVARVYTEPGFYEALGDLPKLGEPEVLERREDGGVVHLAVRFRFTGNLSPAVTRVLDPAKLSWVQEADHDLANGRVTFRLDPDHYADRFRASGSTRYEAGRAGTTRRLTEGEVAVRAPLVGRAVEGAIVSGLRDHFAAEIAVVQRFLAD